MKAIYKMNFDCGRDGSLDGVFVAEDEWVDYLIDNKICIGFGEVLGKHSDVYGTVDRSDITRVSEDEAAIHIIEEYGLSSGHSPFDYPIYFGEMDLSEEDNKAYGEGVFDDWCFEDYYEYKKENNEKDFK